MENPVPAALWLPEDIIHRIFSHLELKQRVKASTLSRDWLNAWRTNPKLDFKICDFHQKNNPLCIFSQESLKRRLIIPKYCRGCEEKFREYVNNYIQLRRRDCQGRHAVEEFHLHMALIKADHVASALINTWLEFAVEFDVKFLWLDLDPGLYSSSTLPIGNVFSEAKSLTQLWVRNCKFPQKIGRGKNIGWKNIKVLNFEHVYITNEMFRCLITGCPSVNDLSIVQSTGLDEIELIGFCSLKKIYIDIDNGFSIEVDNAPCLEHVDLRSLDWLCFDPHGTFLDLESLSLSSGRCIRIAELLNGFAIKFPNLKLLDVSISRFDGLEKINITSESLKCLHWLSETTIEVVEIDVPSIESFRYRSGVIQNFSFINSSCNMRSYACIDPSSGSIIDYSWFLKLLNMIQNLVPSRISLCIEIPKSVHDIQESIEEILIASSCVPVPVEELCLSIMRRHLSHNSCINLIDGLLWACHPKTLVLRFRKKALLSTDDNDENSVIKYLLNVLVDGLDEESSKSPYTKFWQNNLKKVDVKRPAADWKSILGELMSSGDRMEIVFGLEWHDDASLDSSITKTFQKPMLPSLLAFFGN